MVAKKPSSFFIYQRLLQYVKPFKMAFVLALFGNILYGAIDASVIKMLEPLLDQGFVSHNLRFIHFIPVIVVGIFVVRGVAAFLSTYFMGWVGRNVVMQLRQDMFAHLLRLPTSYYDKISSGELLSKITYNVEQVAEASSDVLTEFVRESFTALGLFIVMLSISWRLTLFFIITVPIIAGVMHVVSLRMRRISSRVNDSMAGVVHIAEEAIEGQKVIKAFGGQKYEQANFANATLHNRRQEMKLISTMSINVSIIQLIGSFALAGVVYIATLNPDNILGATITPGAFAAMIAAMVALLKPIRQLTKINGKIQKGIAGASSIFDLLDEKAEQDLGKTLLNKVQGKIEFKQVHFHYASTQENEVNGKKVKNNFNLEDISFTVNPGEVIAIVGKSGSGKSTIVNLLPRFYEAGGTITLDDVNIRDIPLSHLRQSFAFVSQHVMLFNDTIANNIAYGCENVSEQDILEAAHMAYCMDFITNMPSGIHTHIGENGVRLSGGQRQRIAIARAIIKKAPILILDEATSALDTESERKIQQALKQLMKQCTTLVIAHRLSTIEEADRIMVVEDGRITEMGTHQELIQKNGSYHLLNKLQYENNNSSEKNQVGTVLY